MVCTAARQAWLTCIAHPSSVLRLRCCHDAVRTVGHRAQPIKVGAPRTTLSTDNCAALHRGTYPSQPTVLGPFACRQVSICPQERCSVMSTKEWESRIAAHPSSRSP